MEDHQIIELYWQRSSDAIHESDKKYGTYCLAISQRIVQSREDAEECVNDTWLQAWNAMPPHRPIHLSLFLAKITRNLSFNRWSSCTAEKRGGGEMPLVLEELSECIAAATDVEKMCEARELGERVHFFVRALPPREGDVFLRRYFFAEPVSEIAQRYGLGENHVSVMLRRTRQKLKTYLIKEGFFCE